MNEQVDPDVADSLDGLIRAVHRAYRIRLDERGLDLTPPETQALRFLERNPGACLYHLVEETGRDKAQVTRTMRALEDKGMVVRERHPDDQRCHRLHLSDHGLATRAVIGEIRTDIEARLFAGLGIREQRRLGSLLQCCLASLQGDEESGR